MRIGIDIRCLAEGKRTGVEEYTLALLEGLFLRDTENEYVLFFNAWRKTHLDFGWVTKYPNVTLKIFRFPNKLLNLSLWYLRFPKLDKLLGGTDIFFLPNLNFASVSRKTRLVVTAHDLSFELFPETFSFKRRLWHFFINFRRLALSADKVIAISQSTKDDLMAQYGVSGEKIIVIQSGIGKQFHVMSRNDQELLRVKEKYHLPYKFILSLATFEPRKNILALIKAYEALLRLGHTALDKYALVIAGTRGWKNEEVFATIAHSPYREKILLPGFIADADKAALYNLASVFVYPSLYEGFGFPPLEAMACGVPVIVSHSSSLPEIVGNAGVLIDPYQPDELLQALHQVLTDQELTDTLHKKSETRATLFSWEKTVEETLSVFQSLKVKK
ncbi:MAG: glycosyltransferase family 1 protein [Candidatus Moranbacteria bacterium]|nr:glycosyltransferase family 1 protein [Candidatus Moranbacteria bacterium]